jgi:hypothetical protein
MTALNQEKAQEISLKNQEKSLQISMVANIIAAVTLVISFFSIFIWK